MSEIWTAEQYREYHSKAKPHVPSKQQKNGNGDKAKWEMEIMLKLSGLQFEKEFMFHPVRKWKADWAVPELKVLIEYEGLFSEKSSHTTINGFVKDCEKYREAVKLGWKVMRYTQKCYKKLSEDINYLIKQKTV